ncbi:MAG: DUF6714 family protein [Planctomycetota bacterium]
MSDAQPYTKKQLREFGDGVLDIIGRAFSDVSLEGGTTITEAYAIDDYAPATARAEARAKDTYKKWHEADIVTLDPGGSALSFMDPIGFRFHLPAYTHLAVRVELRREPYPDNNCLMHFDEPAMFDVSTGLRAVQFSLLENEHAAVAQFLWFMAEARRVRAYHQGLEYIKPLRRSWWKYLADADRTTIKHRWNIQTSAWPR